MNSNRALFLSHQPLIRDTAPLLKPIRKVKSLVSERELQVIKLIAHEFSTKQIASALYISYDTVCSHRKNILRKLNVKNTAGMVRVAYEQRMLTF